MLSSLPRSEKLEILQILNEKESRRIENPLKYSNCYLPKRHEKQIEFHESDKQIRALFWGNRVGKTEVGGMEICYLLEGTHGFRKVHKPAEIWIGCPSFELQPEGTQAKLKKYLKPSLIKDIKYLREDIWKKVILNDGSVITFKSYEQGREKWQSAEKDIIWFDEEPPSDIWSEAMMRQAAGRKLHVILTMTAVKGMTWVYEDLYMDTGNKNLFFSHAGWDDNPYLDEDQKKFMESAIKDENELVVRKTGKFVSRVGMVCSWWRRDKHVKEYNEFPKDWAYYEVLDGGWSDPSAWLLIAFDTDNNLHVIDGFRQKELTEEEIIEKRNTRIVGITIRSGFCDNDNPRMQLKLAQLGMYLNPVKKESGDSKTWDEFLAIKLAEYGQIQKYNGEPKLYINSKLNWLIQEIENLLWLRQDKKMGEEVKPMWDDHRRFKHHFDGIRALSYLIVMYNKPTKINYDDLPRYQPRDSIIGI